MDLTRLQPEMAAADPRRAGHRERPRPVFGILSWTSLAVGALVFELVLLAQTPGEEGLAAVWSLYIVAAASCVASVIAAVVALARRERMRGIPLAAISLVALGLSWFFGLLGIHSIPGPG